MSSTNPTDDLVTPNEPFSDDNTESIVSALALGIKTVIAASDNSSERIINSFPYSGCCLKIQKAGFSNIYVSLILKTIGYTFNKKIAFSLTERGGDKLVILPQFRLNSPV